MIINGVSEFSCRDLIQRGPKNILHQVSGSKQHQNVTAKSRHSILPRVGGALTVSLIKTQKTKSGLENISLLTTKMIRGISRILPRRFLFVGCYKTWPAHDPTVENRLQFVLCQVANELDNEARFMTTPPQIPTPRQTRVVSP